MRHLPVLFLLMACDTAGPHFRGIDPKHIVVEGAAFDIRVRGDLAEAIRTNAQYAPRLGPLAAKAEHAIESVSGCAVADLKGDQTYLIAQLDCDGTTRVHTPSRGAGSNAFECLKLDSYVSDATGEQVLDLDCDPIL